MSLEQEIVAASASKYGAGKFPHGKCAWAGCEAAACHRYDGGVVCRAHLPDNIIFAPFLGVQENFMSRSERWVLFGGGVGGSKTWASARLFVRQWQVEQERWERGEIAQSTGHAIFFRRTMPELLQVIDDFKRYFKKLDGGATWNETLKIATFPNGYKVQFGGMEGEDDWMKYYGTAYTLIVFDEAVAFTQKQIEELDTRLRSADPVLGKMLQLVLSTNPIGSITKLWLRRRFVEAADPGQPVKVRATLADGRVLEEWQIYLPSNLYDNPALMEDGRYEASLMMRNSTTRRALLLNDWYVDEGAWVGDDWDPTIHICDPFRIPPSWNKFKMADYGFAARSSVMWAATDPEGNVVIYRSISTRGRTAEELAQQIREIEIGAGEWDIYNDHSKIYGPMDSSLWAKSGETGPSRGEIMDNVGCCFYRSDKNRHSAAEQIRSRLRRRTPNAKGDLVIPGLRFFRTCKTRLRAKDGGWEETGPILTIPLVEVDENDPDVWDTDGDDHDLDALAYGCLSRPLPGEEERPENKNQAIVIELLRVRDEPKSRALFPGR